MSPFFVFGFLVKHQCTVWKKLARNNKIIIKFIVVVSSLLFFFFWYFVLYMLFSVAVHLGSWAILMLLLCYHCCNNLSFSSETLKITLYSNNLNIKRFSLIYLFIYNMPFPMGALLTKSMAHLWMGYCLLLVVQNVMCFFVILRWDLLSLIFFFLSKRLNLNVYMWF